MLVPLLAAFLSGPAQQPAREAYAFVHVDVVPMSEELVLRDHTVVVEDGIIRAVAPSAELTPPEGAIVVDGEGLFLMPGLADMHVHSWFEGEHLLFLANGVTTVRNMFGSPLHLAWRDQIASGERTGPTIYTAGPIVDGDPPIWPGSRVVETAEDGRAAVLEQAEAGYDFIKVYNRVPVEAYESIVETAAEVGLLVMGHVPDAVGLAGVLEARQRTVEHLLGYERALQAAEGSGFQTSQLLAWQHVDPARFPEVVEPTREAGVFNCVTLVVLQKRLAPDRLEAELGRPWMRFVPDAQVAMWKSMLARTAAGSEGILAGHAARSALTGALHAGGARILLGTDMGNPFVVAGFSVHEELANLVDAGLTPYEALRAGTVAAAACLDAGDEFGSVTPGHRADLLLLAADPLADVGNVAEPLGVMARGRWLPREELGSELEALAERIHPGESRSH